MLAYFPSQATPFVGRTKMLLELGARLSKPECRLLTITGAGGSGKTRLAIEVARATAPAFAEGVVFVGLQPLASSDLLVPTITRACGLSFYGADEPRIQLLNFLHEKPCILLLDNFEHLLAGTPLIAEILADAAGVKLLVTSREALDLREEWLHPLQGMEAPPSVYSTTLEDYEAVQQITGASLPLLVSLVEKSPINKQPSDRWDMHELLRQYAEEKLSALGILEGVCTAHSHYYVKIGARIPRKIGIKIPSSGVLRSAMPPSVEASVQSPVQDAACL